MASSNLVLNRYATALYQLAHEHGTTEQVEAELVDLDAVLQDNEGLRAQLGNPRLGRDAKRAVMLQIMGDGVSDLLRRTVMLVVDKGRAGLLPDFAAVFNAVAMKASGRVVAQVTSATPLDDGARLKLREQLARITGKSVSLAESVDESLLGGLRVVIGSAMIDGSLSRRLQLLQAQLLQAPVAGVAGD